MGDEIVISALYSTCSTSLIFDKDTKNTLWIASSTNVAGKTG
jgi:hypothetical protein